MKKILFGSTLVISFLLTISFVRVLSQSANVDYSCQNFLDGETIIAEVDFPEEERVFNVSGTNVESNTAQTLYIPIIKQSPLLDENNAELNLRSCIPVSNDFSLISYNNGRLWNALLENNENSIEYNLLYYNYSSPLLNINSSGNANLIIEDLEIEVTYSYSQENYELILNPLEGENLPNISSSEIVYINFEQTESQGSSVSPPFIEPESDNCSSIPNSNQSDLDNDGIGDLCDDYTNPELINISPTNNIPDTNSLSLWLDISKPNLLNSNANGSNLDYIIDHSGNNNHFDSSSLLNKPIYGDGFINLNNVGKLESIKNSGLSSNPSFTIISVVNLKENNRDFPSIISTGSDTSNGKSLFFGLSQATRKLLGGFWNTGEQTNLDTPENQKGIYIWHRNANNGLSDSNEGNSFFTNGILQETNSSTDVIPDLNNSRFILGENLNNSKINADLYELIIYDRALSDSEINQVQSYLSEKHSILTSEITIPPLKPSLDPEDLPNIIAPNTNEIPVIDSLNIWYKADSYSNLPGDLENIPNNGSIPFALDYSGNNNHAFQENNNLRPILKTNAINGNPVISFPSNDLLTTIKNVSVSENVSIFAVARSNDNNTYGRILENVNDRSLFFGTYQNRFASFYGTGRNWNNTNSNGGTPIDQNTFYIMSSINDGNDNAYLNGLLIDSSPDSLSAFSSVLNIGGRLINPNSQPFRGDLAELIVFNKALDDEETNLIHNYLSNKYSIQVSEINDIKLSEVDVPLLDGFLPAENEIKFWLKADSIDELSSYDLPSTSTNEGITYLLDYSGNNNHFFQPNSLNKPTYVSNEISGLPAIRFDNNKLLSSFSDIDFGNEVSTFAVIKPEQYSDYGRILQNQGDRSLFFGTYQNRFASFYGSSRSWNNTNHNNSENFDSEKAYLISSINNGQDKAYFNGLLIDSSEDSLTPFSSKIDFGGRSESPTSQDFNGYVAEIIVYDRALSKEEIVGVNNYLSNKYSLDIEEYIELDLGEVRVDQTFVPVNEDLVARYEATSFDNRYEEIPRFSSGENVNYWLDTSGNNNHLLQLTGDNQPIISRLGNFASINFEQPDFLRSYKPIELNSEVSILAVTRVNSANGYSRILENTEDKGIFFGTKDNKFASFYGDLANWGVTNENNQEIINNEDIYILSSVYNGLDNAYINGELVDSTNDSFNGLNSILNVGGRFNDPNSQPFSGDILELLIYNKALNSSELRELNFYLAEKYNVDLRYKIKSKNVEEVIVDPPTLDDIPVLGSLKVWLPYQSLIDDLNVVGESISRWIDYSGNNHHFQQLDSSREPILTQNGVSFNEYETMQSFNDVELTGNISIFAVTSPSTEKGHTRIINSDKNRNIFFGGRSNKFASFYGNGSQWTGGTGDNGGEELISGDKYILTSVVKPDGNESSYINGEITGVEYQPFNGVLSKLDIGGMHSRPGTQDFDGILHEVIIYNRDLSEDEINSIHEYLSEKHNIEVSSSVSFEIEDPNIAAPSEADIPVNNQMSVWYKTDDINLGSNVYQWFDYSGNNNHAYLNDFTILPEMKNFGIDFNTNSLRTKENVVTDRNISVVTVVRPNGRNSLTSVIRSEQSREVFVGLRNNQFASFYGDSKDWVETNSNGGNELDESRLSLLISTIDNEGNEKTFLNGEFLSTQEENFIGVNSRFNIGGVYNRLGVQSFEGEVAEIIVYNKSLTEEDINLLNQYFQDKYNLDLEESTIYEFTDPIIPSPRDFEVKQDLELWLKADTIENSEVYEWFDYSGNNNHVYREDFSSLPSIGSVNDFQTINFDNESFQTKRKINFNSEITTIALVRPDDINSHSRIVQSNSNRRFFFGTYRNKFASFYGDGSSWGNDTTDNGGEEFDNSNLTLITSILDSDQNEKTFINGISVGVSKDNFTPTNDFLDIGGIYNRDGVQGFSGDIAEILFYNRALSENELNSINNYFAQKYNIEVEESVYYQTSEPNLVSENIDLIPANESLLMWLEGNTITKNSVYEWFDYSGNNNHVYTEDFTRIPELISNSIVGNKVVSFNGTPLQTRKDLGIGPDVSIFAVTKSDKNTRSYERIVNTSNNRYVFFGTNRYQFASFYGNGSTWEDTSSNGGQELEETEFYILSSINDDSGRDLAYINGDLIDSSEDLFFGAETKVDIGGIYSNTNTQSFGGDIAEILVFNDDLNIDQANQVNSYLSNKYSIKLSDKDDDGINDIDDNCPFVFNPDQTDSNFDSLGDACDENIYYDIAVTELNFSEGSNYYEIKADVENLGNANITGMLISWSIKEENSEKNQEIYRGNYGPHTINQDSADFNDNTLFKFTTSNENIDAYFIEEGNYIVSYCVDVENFYDEINKENNCISKLFTFGDLDSDEDIDLDGISNSSDNCPNNFNPNQSDIDENGIGDVCDDIYNDQQREIVPDIDRDGIADESDNCIDVYNPDQLDINPANQIGDACENRIVNNNDLDEDGVIDVIDNCPTLFNRGQIDLDNDTIGDTCDEDIDGDTINNFDDNCPYIYNPTQKTVCDTSSTSSVLNSYIYTTTNNVQSDPKRSLDLSTEEKVFLGLDVEETYSNKSILPDRIIESLFPYTNLFMDFDFDLSDSDFDGLTDAFEHMISQTNPLEPVSDGVSQDYFSVLKDPGFEKVPDVEIKDELNITFPSNNSYINNSKPFILAWSSNANTEYDFVVKNKSLDEALFRMTGTSDLNGFILNSLPENKVLTEGVYEIESYDKNGFLLDSITFTVTDEIISYKIIDVKLSGQMTPDDIKVIVKVPPNKIVTANWQSLVSASAAVSSVFSDEVVLRPPKHTEFEPGEHKVVLVLKDRDSKSYYDIVERRFYVIDNNLEIEAPNYTRILFAVFLIIAGGFFLVRSFK